MKLRLARKLQSLLSSYCGLVDARINASDKDLPVLAFAVKCTFSGQNRLLIDKYLLYGYPL